MTNTNDSGTGSLRQAIADVAAGGTITFSPLFAVPDPTDPERLDAPQTITLTSGQLEITKAVTITGPGANLLTVRRDGSNPDVRFRIFSINSGVTAVLSGMTIANGDAFTGEGGGVRNAGALTIANSVLVGNRGIGGGIQNSGTLTVTGSTIRDSVNESGGGAGLRNISPGVAILTNSTISGNQSGGNGAGIFNFAFNGTATVQLTNCTVTNNTDPGSSGGAVLNFAQGAGTVATTTLRNTIVAGNSLPNLRSSAGGGQATITSSGYNLTDDPTNEFLNQATDRVNMNALLAPLANNGGTTPTHALLFGSPAIDAGNSSGSINDQRGPGFLRVVDLLAPNASGGDAADIGALELQSEPPPATASIGGRVLRPSGSVLGGIRVNLLDPQGVVRVATTSSFGEYLFTNLPTGQTYLLTVSSKRYRFAPQNVLLNGNVANLELRGLE